MNSNDSRAPLRELLPWYENGTLRPDEREAVRALLATDLEANRQRRELRALREVLSDDPLFASNVAVNLRHLDARLGRSAATPAERTAPRWLALAALLALALGVGTFFAGERAARYETLTAPQPLPATPLDASLLRVDVVPGMDAAELALLAGDPGVRVLRGPSGHGVATLAVPRGHEQQVTARLRADPRLRFIAPVPR
jgi:hypothetical protein